MIFTLDSSKAFSTFAIEGISSSFIDSYLLFAEKCEKIHPKKVSTRFHIYFSKRAIDLNTEILAFLDLENIMLAAITITAGIALQQSVSVIALRESSESTESTSLIRMYAATNISRINTSVISIESRSFMFKAFRTRNVNATHKAM